MPTVRICDYKVDTCHTVDMHLKSKICKIGHVWYQTKCPGTGKTKSSIKTTTMDFVTKMTKIQIHKFNLEIYCRI